LLTKDQVQQEIEWPVEHGRVHLVWHRPDTRRAASPRHATQPVDISPPPLVGRRP